MRAPERGGVMSIPTEVRARYAVTHEERYEGRIALKSLSRIADLVTSREGALEVRMQASRDGFDRLAGVIRGTLPLQCRRCQKVYDWTLNAEMALRLVWSEAEEARADTAMETYLVAEDSLPLRELIEDEVLLALPMLPRCETCENAVQEVAPPVPAEAPARENPFAALKQKLKTL